MAISPGRIAFGSRINIVKAQIDRGGISALWQVATPVDVSSTPITAEEHQITRSITLKGRTSIVGETVNWEMPDTYIHSGSVTVKNEDETITYTENVDYSVGYDGGTITRIDSGTIRWNQNIRVTYRWEEPMLLARSGNPRPENENATVEYDDGTEIIGLLHIPKYDSPLKKIGFFEMGDAIFTTTSLNRIKARGYGDYNYMTRDILTINDGVEDQIWHVLAKPETIQLAGEYLAHKVHIRKLKEGEVIP